MCRWARRRRHRVRWCGRPAIDAAAAELVRPGGGEVRHLSAGDEGRSALEHVEDVGVDLVHLGLAGRVPPAGVDLVVAPVEQHRPLGEGGLHRSRGEGCHRGHLRRVGGKLGHRGHRGAGDGLVPGGAGGPTDADGADVLTPTTIGTPPWSGVISFTPVSAPRPLWMASSKSLVACWKVAAVCALSKLTAEAAGKVPSKPL